MMNRLSLQPPLAPKPWPDPPTDDFLAQPRRSHDLLAHWECWLYQRYRTVFVGPDTSDKSFWLTHIKEFADLVASCQILRDIYHPVKTDAERSRNVHEILTLFFLYYDMLSRNNMRGVFGFEDPPPFPDEAETRKRASKGGWIKARNTLLEARRLVREALTDTDPAATQEEFERLFKTALDRVTRRPGPGPDAIVLHLDLGNEEQGIVLAPQKCEAAAPAVPHSGQPAGTNGDVNMVFTLLVDRLRGVLKQRNHNKVALRLLEHFSGHQCQKTVKQLSEDSLRKTVARFTRQCRAQAQQAHAQKDQVELMRDWLTGSTSSSPTGHGRLCPYPPYLLSASSYSVVDTPH